MKTKLFLFALMSLFLFAACGKKEEPKPPMDGEMLLITEKAVGEEINLTITAVDAHKANVWIDLNMNGTRDAGEAVSNFGKEQAYTLASTSFKVYGKVIEFNCAKNALTALDVSKNKALIALNSQFNKLSSLDLSKNELIKQVDIYGNAIRLPAEMDKLVNGIRSCPESSKGLFRVVFNHDSKENTISATQVKVLTDKNWEVKDSKGNPYKGELADLPIPEPDPSPDPIDNSHLITFTTQKAVGATIKLRIEADEADKKDVWIDLNNNGKKDAGEGVVFPGKEYTIGAQNITLYGKVRTFDCSNNELTKLDLSKNAVLKVILCDRNKLSELDLSNNKALTQVLCNNNNKLSQLDLSNNEALEQLFCARNELRELVLTQNKLLGTLDCSFNKLSSLDITANNNLTHIDCSYNQLTALDISNKPALRALFIDRNHIAETQMQKIVNDIRICDVANKGRIKVFDPTDSKEKNKITAAQLDALRTKNWNVMD